MGAVSTGWEAGAPNGAGDFPVSREDLGDLPPSPAASSGDRRPGREVAARSVSPHDVRSAGLGAAGRARSSGAIARRRARHSPCGLAHAPSRPPAPHGERRCVTDHGLAHAPDQRAPRVQRATGTSSQPRAASHDLPGAVGLEVLVVTWRSLQLQRFVAHPPRRRLPAAGGVVRRRDPEPVGDRRPEVALHEVRRPGRALVGPRSCASVSHAPRLRAPARTSAAPRCNARPGRPRAGAAATSSWRRRSKCSSWTWRSLSFSASSRTRRADGFRQRAA